jgi:hypothetical protein
MIQTPANKGNRSPNEDERSERRGLRSPDWSFEESRELGKIGQWVSPKSEELAPPRLAPSRRSWELAGRGVRGEAEAFISSKANSSFLGVG